MLDYLKTSKKLSRLQLHIVLEKLLWVIFLFVIVANQEAILLIINMSLASLIAQSLEVNQWIALDFQSLSSQSEHAKNSIHSFTIY